MTKDQLVSEIIAAFPSNVKGVAHSLTDRKGHWIDLDSARAQGILAHYASKPKLRRSAIALCISDLKGENVK
jgi:hypothetical protein